MKDKDRRSAAIDCVFHFLLECKEGLYVNFCFDALYSKAYGNVLHIKSLMCLGIARFCCIR